MLAVIQENDQHSREVLTMMLREFGFAQVQATTHLEETLYFLEKEQDTIDLVVSSYSEGDGLDFPISRVILKNPKLDRCPLIVLTENWRNKSFSPFKSRLSRVDQVLSRPFGRASLEEAVASAFEHRAKFRNTLVFYGTEASAKIIEEEIFSNPQLQWKSLVAFQDPKIFSHYLFHSDRRLGGVLFEADAKVKDAASELRRFKRSRMGSAIPITCFGQDPEFISPFVTFLDLSFDHSESWLSVLEILSQRSTYSWRVGRMVSSIRQAIKEEKPKLAKRFLNEARAKDEDRWEVLELGGYLEKKSELLLKALDTQPCSPFAYLRLLELLEGSQRRAILQKSALYCPRHPELMALRK
jgi:CheY-like chemotaxis protein